jgi:hypothetical protein
MANDTCTNNVEHEKKLFLIEDQILKITRDIGMINSDIESINEWMHEHELEHKDISNDIKQILKLLEKQENDKEKVSKELIALNEKDKGKMKFILFVKNAKEILTFMVLIFGIISAISLWFYDKSEKYKEIETYIHDSKLKAGEK